MPQPAIQIKNLSVTLSRHFQALRDISVSLERGKIIGLIGPSGSGKTTLMRVLVGRQRITSGEVHIFDVPAGSPVLRKQVSYMTQETSVYPDLTVGENLHYFAAMFGISASEIKTKVSQIVQTVDLNSQVNHIVSQLSGGQKQRVSLAIALIGKPALMVLDEPTVGLDPVLRIELWALFHRLAEAGSTLVVSSHVMDEAEHCDDLLLIRDGSILAHGAPSQLRRQTGTDSVEESYLKLVRAKS